jgi:hypothetical protein
MTAPIGIEVDGTEATRLTRPQPTARRGLSMMYLAVLLWETVGPAMQLVVAAGPADAR